MKYMLVLISIFSTLFTSVTQPQPSNQHDLVCKSHQGQSNIQSPTNSSSFIGGLVLLGVQTYKWVRGKSQHTNQNTQDLYCYKHGKIIQVPLEEYNRARDNTNPLYFDPDDLLSQLINNACQEQHDTDHSKEHIYGFDENRPVPSDEKSKPISTQTAAYSQPSEASVRTSGIIENQNAETTKTEAQRPDNTQLSSDETPPQKTAFVAAIHAKYSQQVKSEDVPSDNAKFFAAVRAAQEDTQIKDPETLDSLDNAKLWAAVRVAKEKNLQSQRTEPYPVTEVQEDTQDQDLAAISAVTNILANIDYKFKTHPASQQNPKSVVLATLQKLIDHSFDNLAEGNVDQAIQGACALEGIGELISGKESFVFSKKGDKAASAISSRSYYGVTPEPFLGDLAELSLDGGEYAALLSSAGNVIYEECKQVGNELREGAETLITIVGVAEHYLDGSKHLRMERERLLAKQERGEPLNQLEQDRLQWIPKQLAIRERLLKNMTVKKVGHKVIETLVTTAPYLALSYACPGIAPRIFMALKGLDIVSNIAEKTLTKKAEQLYEAVRTDSSETVAREMAKTYDPLQARLNTNTAQDNQHILPSIERKLKNKAYGHLAKGNLKRAADTAVTSMLIDTIVSKSSLYNTETDRILLKMIETDPRCRELFEQGELTIPEPKSFDRRVADWLVQSTTKQSQHPQNLQDVLKNDAIERLAAREDDNGLQQGIKNIQEDMLNRQRQAKVIFDLFKAAYQAPAETGKALVKTAIEEGGKTIVRSGLKYPLDRSINETVGRLQDNIRKDVGNQLLELGASIDKKGGPMAGAMGDLFQELAAYVSNPENSQTAEKMGNVLLEFAGKAEHNDKIVARDMFLNAAILMEARGDQAARVTVNICKSLANALNDIILEEIDSSSIS